jgi:hypothetical protein
MPKTEIYVGNLVRDITRKEIEDVFEKYGRLRRCDLKNKGFGATYAFLEFDEESDAEVIIIATKITFFVLFLCHEFHFVKRFGFIITRNELCFQSEA